MDPFHVTDLQHSQGKHCQMLLFNICLYIRLYAECLKAVHQCLTSKWHSEEGAVFFGRLLQVNMKLQTVRRDEISQQGDLESKSFKCSIKYILFTSLRDDRWENNWENKFVCLKVMLPPIHALFNLVLYALQLDILPSMSLILLFSPRLTPSDFSFFLYSLHHFHVRLCGPPQSSSKLFLKQKRTTFFTSAKKPSHLGGGAAEGALEWWQPS